MANEIRTAQAERFNIFHFVVRLLIGTIVLAITAYLTPGFTISGVWALILGAAIIAILDYVVSNAMGRDISPLGRGITGFILSAVIIYAAQFFVAGFAVTFWGAVLGALIYGIVDAMIPGKAM